MLTAVQLAAKRIERTMKSRAKKQGKRTAFGLMMVRNAHNRAKTQSWLERMGAAQEKAQQEMNALQRQAQESRRAKAAMSQHHSKGLVGRIKSFFRGK